jgi:hypothetical protein
MFYDVQDPEAYKNMIGRYVDMPVTHVGSVTSISVVSDRETPVYTHHVTFDDGDTRRYSFKNLREERMVRGCKSKCGNIGWQFEKIFITTGRVVGVTTDGQGGE